MRGDLQAPVESPCQVIPKVSLEHAGAERVRKAAPEMLVSSELSQGIGELGCRFGEKKMDAGRKVETLDGLLRRHERQAVAGRLDHLVSDARARKDGRARGARP